MDKILLVDRAHPCAHGAVSGVGLHPQIQQHAEKRGDDNKQHPGQLIIGILAVVEHIDENNKNKQRLSADKVFRHKLAEIDPHHKGDGRLNQQKQDDKPGAAEDHRQKAALPAAFETDAVFVDFDFFPAHTPPSVPVGIYEII